MAPAMEHESPADAERRLKRNEAVLSVLLHLLQPVVSDRRDVAATALVPDLVHVHDCFARGITARQFFRERAAARALEVELKLQQEAEARRQRLLRRRRRRMRAQGLREEDGDALPYNAEDEEGLDEDSGIEDDAQEEEDNYDNDDGQDDPDAEEGGLADEMMGDPSY
jgi:hypothetical protein